MTLLLDVDAVQRAQQAGTRLDYRFFWGHQPPPDGALADSCFSQWWPARFTIDGQVYLHAEQFMMAQKAQRFDLVTRGNVAKFGQNPQLRAYLLASGEDVLVEASPLDRVWGIGLAASHEHAQQPARWRGLNLLGFALMRARAILRGELPPL